MDRRDHLVSTKEISAAYGISRNHLVRVVQTLQAHGFVKASTGRGGGIALARDPAAINIGDVVRKTEPNLRLVECFDPAGNTCRIAPICTLRGTLARALEAFMAVLDDCTLADLMRKGEQRNIAEFLQLTGRSAATPLRAIRT